MEIARKIVGCVCLSLYSLSFLSCSQNEKKTLYDILERDSMEVHDMMLKALNSNVNHIWIAAARYENGQKPQGFELIHECPGNKPVVLTGTLNYWDDVKREDWGYSTRLVHSDTLNMMRDFSEILQSCKKIADGNEIIFLSAHNQLSHKEEQELTEIPCYVEMLFYYQKKHYLLIYTDYNRLKELLEYAKRHYYPDLDYANTCTKVMDNVFLIGFSSQDDFFKNH